MKKKLLIAVLFMLILGFLLACNSDNDSTEEKKDSSTSHKDEQVVIYSNSASEGRGEWLKEQASEAGYNIEIVEMGGADLFNRLLAEKNNPIADLTFGMTQMDWKKLKDEDALISYEPEWIDEIPDGSSDADNTFHPIVEQRIVMLYNGDKFDEQSAPKDWIDLWENKEYHQQYHVPNALGGGTNRAVIYNILTRYLDESGEYGVSDEGWKAVENYIKNGYITPEGEDHNANLADGSVPISFYYSSGIPGIEEEFSFEAQIVSPEVGVPSTIEQVGIMNHGDDHDYTAAQEFIDWFGSSDIQGKWAEEFGSLPVNELALEHAGDRMKEIKEMTTVQEIDYDLVSENIDAWMEKIELEFY